VASCIAQASSVVGDNTNNGKKIEKCLLSFRTPVMTAPTTAKKSLKSAKSRFRFDIPQNHPPPRLLIIYININRP